MHGAAGSRDLTHGGGQGILRRLEHRTFSNRMRVFRRPVAAGLLVALATAGCACRHAAAETGRAREMAVRRGEFRERFVLTGELDAVRADQIVVPRTPVWVIAIRWMEADGATVEA